MAVTEQATTALIGVFADPQQAEQFVNELKRAGFRDDQIGVARRHDETSTAEKAEEGAAAGAVAGGTLGVLAGIAVAVGLIPGIGPVLAGGVLASLLASAATGAAAGGVLGALLGLGIPEEEARGYEEHLRAGRTLVVVQGGTRLPQALTILRRFQNAA